MDRTSLILLVFGGLVAGALIMFFLERRAVAKRKAARGGREVDVTNLIFFGSEAGEGKKTHQ